MRTGQLQALSNTRERSGHPFDVVDIGFGLLSAVSGSPIAFGLAIGQYFARRSGWVAEALLVALDLPPAIEDSRAIRAVLPGIAKALPAPADDDDPKVPARAGAQTTVLLSTQQWREALDDSPHLLIYGPSKAGKSTLAQAVVAMLKGCEYVVIDPQPNKPGEQKWGGVDFITLDEHGDEYASIKAALARVQKEDTRRRRSMRQETPRPLVVIIDEVLALVGALGTILNEEGKKEARMAHFIRTMGYSARHRNIKIILIGQGKNLSDLGLNSGTARNNYALVRAARNVATGARSAFIEAGDDEQPINVEHVVKLANAIGARARVWLRHADVAAVGTSGDDLLSSLLAAPPPPKLPEKRAEKVFTEPERIPEQENVFLASESSFPNFPHFSASFSAAEKAQIKDLIRAGKTKTEIVRGMPAYSTRRHTLYVALYEQLRREVDQERPSHPDPPGDPDAPDPSAPVPAAFAGIFSNDPAPQRPAPASLSDEEFFDRLPRLTLAQLHALTPANEVQRGALAFAIQVRASAQ